MILTRSFKNVSAGFTVLAASLGTTIRVQALVLTADLDCRINFGKDASTATTGNFYLLKGTPLVLPYNPDGWFAADQGDDLGAKVVAAGAVNVGIQATWGRD